ncbi:MAG: hypothetical protein B6245_21980 [Desulfobacteraceae bacterium 4572_88]|nr:MAG: hypothetical protein B6245_21980 [Desulfobacteraceae bacterium 4572_88]
MIGDWTLILGEVLETHVDEDKADESKREGINVSKINPLIYCTEVHYYWDMGTFLGYGFNSGKESGKKLEKRRGRRMSEKNNAHSREMLSHPALSV